MTGLLCRVQEDREWALKRGLDEINKEIEAASRADVACWFPMGTRDERIVRLAAKEAQLLNSRCLSGRRHPAGVPQAQMLARGATPLQLERCCRLQLLPVPTAVKPSHKPASEPHTACQRVLWPSELCLNYSQYPPTCSAGPEDSLLRETKLTIR